MQRLSQTSLLADLGQYVTLSGCYHIISGFGGALLFVAASIFIIAVAAMVTLYAYEIKTWRDHRNEFCVQNILMWLLVDGAIGFTSLSLNVLMVVTGNNKKSPNGNTQKSTSTDVFSFGFSLLALFNFVWTIVGSVYAYRTAATPQKFDPSSCDRTAFLLCWWVVTLSWCVLGVLLCAFCATFAYASNRSTGGR